MLHPAQAPAQNYKIRAIHQIPSSQNGYVAVFTAYIEKEYCQMWCNCSQSDPAKLSIGFEDTEPTMLGGEVLYINTVFVPLEYSELSFSQLCEVIQHNDGDWEQTDAQTSGVYAPILRKGRKRVATKKMADYIWNKGFFEGATKSIFKKVYF